MDDVYVVIEPSGHELVVNVYVTPEAALRNEVPQEALTAADEHGYWDDPEGGMQVHIASLRS